MNLVLFGQDSETRNSKTRNPKEREKRQNRKESNRSVVTSSFAVLLFDVSFEFRISDFSVSGLSGLGGTQTQSAIRRANHGRQILS
jgi:hypothetical protein